MSVAALLGTPCTLLVAAVRADDYDQTPGTPSQVATVCELQQVQSSEAGDAVVEVSTWQVFFPAGTVLRGVDAFLVDGARYELVGDPWVVRNPRTRMVSHVQALARRTT